MKQFVMNWYNSRTPINKIALCIFICLTFISALCSIIWRDKQYLQLIGALWIAYLFFYLIFRAMVSSAKERWQTNKLFFKLFQKSVKQEVQFLKDARKNLKEKKEKEDDPFL